METSRSTSRRQSAGGVGRAREHACRARRRQSAGDVGSGRQQGTVADALQQQVDDYLASFDPEKPLYQDGWAMGEMQESLQQSLWRLLEAVVHGCGVARIPLSTCEFCDARGTHVQVYFFLLWCKQALELYVITTCTRAIAGVQQ